MVEGGVGVVLNREVRRVCWSKSAKFTEMAMNESHPRRHLPK